MKTMTRKELAYRAGVCTRTLRNWTDDHLEELQRMGMKKGCALPPNVCEWIVENYGIDMSTKQHK